MKKIASFTVNHDTLMPGMYISRVDGDITTFDLRTRRPNAGSYMDTRTAHSVEHMLATFLRNGSIADNVIYFGPMGCRTGFYLLTRGVEPAVVKQAVMDALRAVLAHTGEVFGAKRQECGNYKDLDLLDAKRECEAYLAVLEKDKGDFRYAE